jgi:hypothetical protein
MNYFKELDILIYFPMFPLLSSSLGSTKGFFYDIHYKNLVEFQETKVTIVSKASDDFPGVYLSNLYTPIFQQDFYNILSFSTPRPASSEVSVHRFLVPEVSDSLYLSVCTFNLGVL